MTYRLVEDLAADGIPVAAARRVLRLAKQALHRWKTDPVCQLDWDDAHLINVADDIHADDPAFGYRFIADELPGLGIHAGRNRVARLCWQQTTTWCNASGKVAGESPNQDWPSKLDRKHPRASLGPSLFEPRPGPWGSRVGAGRRTELC
jgi:hypothetical protein